MVKNDRIPYHLRIAEEANPPHPIVVAVGRGGGGHVDVGMVPVPLLVAPVDVSLVFL
jgi:hypothetical protein